MQTREEELIAQIRAHDVAYYVQGQPTVTDAEYDALVRELRVLEQAAGRALPDSPTQRIGSDLSGAFPKVAHLRPMLSLENVFTTAEIIDFFESLELAQLPGLAVEAKIDGLALELRYRGGRLVQAVTRGDGTTGDDVTANARAVRGIPLVVAIDTLDVRGEIYMARSAFRRLNEQRAKDGDDLFANPRNTAAGSFKQQSPAEVARRNLSFVAYWSTLPAGLTQAQMTRELMTLGFPTLQAMPLLDGGVISLSYTTDSCPAVGAAVDLIARSRDLLDLDIDGVVVKLDNRRLQAEVGAKTRAPRWGCAFKFPPERQATLLRDIEITIGRTGQVTPNARLKPVALSGATVSNASLMNIDELARIGNPGIGDEVWVERSAEIIPRLTGVKTRLAVQPWMLPEACPFCQTKLVRRGVHYYDPNPTCPERIYARLRYATSKACLDWDGLGEVQLYDGIQYGSWRRLSDLLGQDGAGISWMKPAALKKFLVERERVKDAALWRKLACLGIEDIGRSVSKDLAARYGSLTKIIEAIEYKTIPLGPVALSNLVRFLQEEFDELERLEALGFIFTDTQRSTGPLSGKTIVITGTLSSGTREAISAKIEAAGGLTKSSVTKSTDYLVAGEAPGDNKTKAAAKHGTKVITEVELYALMGQEMPVATEGAANLDEA